MHLSWPAWKTWLPALLWLLVLALLPWWLGLALLLASAFMLWWRPAMSPALPLRALRWGLPGLMLAVLRTFGGDILAVLVALLAGLVGFSLLMLLEDGLRRRHAHPAVAAAGSEWPELALLPSGPQAHIIELQPPRWVALDHELTDPLGGQLGWRGNLLCLADGSQLDGVEPRCEFGGDGRWLVLPLTGAHGLLLLDRRRGNRHRLRGWQLSGWDDGVPWLCRDEDRGPQPVAHVLGRDDDD